MSTDKNNDEIDLRQVFASIGGFFSNIGTGIIRFIATLRRIALNNKVLFLSLLILSQLVAVVYTKLVRKDYYTSTMILSSQHLNRQTAANTIEKLNLLCDEEGRTELARTLNIDLEIAKNIFEFDFNTLVTEGEKIEFEILKEQLAGVIEEKRELANRVASKLNQENTSSFIVSVSVYDPEIIADLETALLNYLKNNTYIKKRLESNRTLLLERKVKLIKESKKLDSLKKVIYENFTQMATQSKGSNNVILGDKYLTDPLAVFKEDLSLNSQILDIDRELYIQPGIEIIDGFTAFREPDNLSLPTVMLIAMGVSIILSYLIIAFIKFNNYLDKIPV